MHLLNEVELEGNGEKSKKQVFLVDFNPPLHPPPPENLKKKTVLELSAVWICI